MKKILLLFALTAAVMTANAQVKELEPYYISEWIDPATFVKEECEGCPEDGEGDSAQDCFPVTNIKATSRLASQGANNYNEKNLYDEDFKTSWVEGVKGYGIGEKITFTLEDVYAGATGIIITNGYSKSPTAWKNNSRVKKLKLSVDGDEMTRTFTVTLEILDVYKGDKYDDTAISEVLFLGCY